MPGYFYPRSPCGERHLRVVDGSKSSIISIHALLAESDLDQIPPRGFHYHFYPRSPCGERPLAEAKEASATAFLSTLSLRRATDNRIFHVRSLTSISIHALLAESDSTASVATLDENHFYPRSPCGERPRQAAIRMNLNDISIHALLAESDQATQDRTMGRRHFYPRSPCGERRRMGQAAGSASCISIHALLAESDALRTPGPNL